MAELRMTLKKKNWNSECAVVDLQDGAITDEMKRIVEEAVACGVLAFFRSSSGKAGLVDMVSVRIIIEKPSHFLPVAGIAPEPQQ